MLRIFELIKVYREIVIDTSPLKIVDYS